LLFAAADTVPAPPDAFFFGAADKLESVLKREKQEPDVLIRRMRKVMAMDATGLNALEDLYERLHRRGKHLVLSAPHTQPLFIMEKAGFLDRISRDNVRPHITAALARAREIPGLPPVVETLEAQEALHAEKRELEGARRELSAALERTNRTLNRPKTPTSEPNTKNDEAA
jgi:SulP family sulfate permease